MAEYIEREAAIKAAEEADYTLIANDADSCKTDYLREIIESVPAADVVPVAHGWWDGDNCTACKLPWKWNMVQDADDWGYFDPMPDYCPNCGAKMDGGADND